MLQFPAAVSCLEYFLIQYSVNINNSNSVEYYTTTTQRQTRIATYFVNFLDIEIKLMFYPPF